MSRKRLLRRISLEEALELLKLAGLYNEKYTYKIRRKKNRSFKFAQVYHKQVYEGRIIEFIDLNISDTRDALHFYHLGNTAGSFERYYKATKYLEQKNFDLENASKSKQS